MPSWRSAVPGSKTPTLKTPAAGAAALQSRPEPCSAAVPAAHAAYRIHRPQPALKIRKPSYPPATLPLYADLIYSAYNPGEIVNHHRLSESVSTLYAELLDQSILAAAEDATRNAPSGAFTSKNIKGRTYWYLQRSEGERKRQIYIGPDSPALNSWMKQVRETRDRNQVDVSQRRRLCAMLAAGGATTEPAAVIKVLQLLSEARVFQLGGVLIGTLAYRTLANVLGVQFDQSALRTQDVDIAQDPAIGVALARETSAVDLDEALNEADLGFQSIPALDRKNPSTSFKIHGRELRVDLLTPMRGRESSTPIYLPAYNLSAQPLRFLEYLIETPIQATVIATDAVLVNLPDPARFALHKLWTSGKRSPAFQTKARKDLLQASQLLEVLLEDRPSDVVAAWEALKDYRGVKKKILDAATRIEPEVKKRLETALGISG